MSLPIYLAHGAGAGHNNAFLQSLFATLSEKMVNVVIPVTFSYMAEQEQTGKKRPPPRFNTLVSEYMEVIGAEHDCVVAGKSMGGRVATQLTHNSSVKAVICYGFPFYPSGKPEKHRLSYFKTLKKYNRKIEDTINELADHTKNWLEKTL